MVISHGMNLAASIASEASFETRETVYENIDHYRENNFTYIPLPLERRYVNSETEEEFDLETEQYVHEDASAYSAISHLRNHPFLMVDVSGPIYLVDGSIKVGFLGDMDGAEYVGIHSGNQKVQQEHKQEILDIIQGRLHIITLADVNKRVARDTFYPVVAEFENQLAKHIKKTYSGDRQCELVPEISVEAIGRWEKAKQEGMDLHISEFMTLSDMLKISSKNQDLRGIFGFDSRNQFENSTGGLVDIRHRIMHVARTLVHDADDLENLIDKAETAHDLLEDVGVQVNRSNYDVPHHS